MPVLTPHKFIMLHWSGKFWSIFMSGEFWCVVLLFIFKDLFCNKAEKKKTSSTLKKNTFLGYVMHR